MATSSIEKPSRLPLRKGWEEQLPLTAVTFHTLLCLIDGPMHGYAIARQIEERSGQRIRMGPGTLYGSLHRLRELDYIEECEPPDGGESERRRYYRLTDYGRQVLEAEAQRLAEDVRLLRSKKVIR